MEVMPETTITEAYQATLLYLREI
ncbi:hypothetical protein LCGC14_2956300, partial [marine sediment metagenome]